MSDNIFAVHGADRRCTSYRPGHQVHWIQYFKSARASLVIPVVPVLGGGGLVRIEWDGSSLDHWHHDPALMNAALQRSGGVAGWKPQWHVLVVPTADVPGAGNVFNLAAPDQRTACVHSSG